MCRVGKVACRDAAIRTMPKAISRTPTSRYASARSRYKLSQRGGRMTGSAPVNVAEKKRLTGRIAAENIKLMAVPRPPAGAVERLLALGDPTGIISDTMDELGI